MVAYRCSYSYNGAKPAISGLFVSKSMLFISYLAPFPLFLRPISHKAQQVFRRFGTASRV